MAKVHAEPEPLIGGNIFEEADKFKKRGNWTEERHAILEKLSMEEITADIMRIQAENPGRFSTPEEIDAKIMRLEAELAAKRRAEMVGA